MNNEPGIWTRRRFLGTGAASLLGWAGAAPATGKPAPAGLAEIFDQAMEKFMKERDMPGGALAVVKDRRLVHARGYGWADREKKIPAQPDSLFRIASISKPITAIAVLRLVEDKKLRMEDRMRDLVKLPVWLPDGEKADPRLEHITVRHLLHHTAGWDRDKSGDPMFRSRQIARDLGETPPAGAGSVIRHTLGRPLDFDPGTRYAYSNFGYCLLGRIIERASGRSYEQFVREKVLAPIGIRRMRIGATLNGRQAAGEVRYYTPTDAKAGSVFGDEPAEVPGPYGGFYLEAMDAHGGWIASAVDLARFAAALHDVGRPQALKPATMRLMDEPPEPPVSRRPDGTLEDHWYGCGWMVRPIPAFRAPNRWHAGSLPGTTTLLVRRGDGVSYAALFNLRSKESQMRDGAIDPLLYQAADAVKEWPKEDLFPRWGRDDRA